MKPEELGLMTDLYELTMAQSYLEHGLNEWATFSLFIRNYPPNRAYFVSAGLEEVLKYLEGWSFSPDDIKYLRTTGIFSQDFLDYLSGVRFTGDVWAIPEGRLFFADEPVLEVTAPIIEAQIVETFIINQINLQSMIATKASRCVWAARGRTLVDFSLRRTQGIDAGVKAARACYIAGFDASSNMLAGKIYGTPPGGTMAHSFISCYENELDAFRSFAESFPERSILIIDTYDTVAGAEKAAMVGKEMESLGQHLQGIRLDSGDLGCLSRDVREVLDGAGLGSARIVASGGLDEMDIADLIDGGAPIDGFGIGTKMGVSADAPWSDMAYKLVKYGDRPVLKLSTGKISQPDRKQVFRYRDNAGMFAGDTIALRDEKLTGGEPLLEQVMEEGRIIGDRPTMEEIRSRFRDEYACLDDRFKVLRNPPQYEVTISPRLMELSRNLEARMAAKEVPGAG